MCLPTADDLCISVILLAAVKDVSRAVLVSLARSVSSLAVIAGVAKGALGRSELRLVIV